MSRLTAHLDGSPAYLYRFTQGQYEDKRVHLCAHREQMTAAEALARLAAVAATLPEQIDFDYGSNPPYPKDLFEQALVLAGFEDVDGEIASLWVRESFPPATDRYSLLRALEDAK